MNSYLDDLNEAQSEAVCTIDGALLVLAGAGTGKTRVLTTRIAHILETGSAFAHNILAVTFTNKAAKEMQYRVQSIAGSQSTGVWIGTFHSICLKIIRRHTHVLGLKNDFTIIDQDDQTRLIKQLLKASNIDDKRFPAKMVAGAINSLKDKAITTDKLEFATAVPEVIKIYKEYQARLKALNCVDFGDLILHCITLFNKDKQVLELYQNRFKYILVDEYQDTNVAQYLLLRLLAQSHKNICCVGDDDQSIYGWRGAEVENILRFEKDFKGAKTIRLECNYRSTPQILATANSIIKHNKSRLGKKLYSPDENGNKVDIVSFWDERAEANFIGNRIEELKIAGQTRFNDNAILIRAGFQTRIFEECFLSQNIPYRIIGGLRFYERMEIKDAISYIRFAVNQDNDLALERIINTPKRGVGQATVKKLAEFAKANNTSMAKSINHLIERSDIKGKTAVTLVNLMKDFTKWLNLFREAENNQDQADLEHHKIVDKILHESDYIGMWQAENTLEAQGRVENLKELISAIKEFEDIDHFLEHISLVMDTEKNEQSDMVSVMTMHGSKGLEFDNVYLAGWEEGLFPSQRSMDESGDKGLEEERRLAYVGITRAKKNLMISFATSRFTYGQNLSNVPSRFIDDLPKEHINIINGGTNYGASGSLAGRLKSTFSKGFNKSVKKSENSAIQISTNGFKTGQRIFHQKFGYGKITNINAAHLSISFDKAGKKTLLDEYVENAG